MLPPYSLHANLIEKMDNNYYRIVAEEKEQKMDLIHSFLNIIAPPFALFSLVFFLPPFQIFKFFISVFNEEDIAGKVVIITGASSGIGENLAYEYAKRGACLVLAARRERSLQDVAEKAHYLGSPDVLVVRADVSKVEDCRNVIDRTMNHFKRLDHLVNNAGFVSMAMLEDLEDVTDFRAVWETNFWGFVYMTRFAAPYLRNSRGRIVAISSCASWMASPRMAIYNASKAAIVQFFETLRVEFGQEIGITIATPGVIESEMTKGKHMNKSGRFEVNPDMRDVQMFIVPFQSAKNCAKGIVQSAIRGERYVTEQKWFKVSYYWMFFFPELIEWIYRIFYITSPGEPVEEALAKKVLDYTGAKSVLYPESILTPEIKKD